MKLGIISWSVPFAWGKAWLTKNPVSDNVGGVKQISSVVHRALVEERHFALAEEVQFQPRRGGDASCHHAKGRAESDKPEQVRPKRPENPVMLLVL
jgi:hypothetical protein